MNKQLESKHAKYTTGNFISRYLVNRFFDSIYNHVSNIEFNSFLEVGCGEGMVLKYLEPQLNTKKCQGIDIDPVEVKDAQTNVPFATISQASAYELPFNQNEFDLVICCEVLEHLQNPEKALKEISRVANHTVLLSVPNEPTWRFLNIARGAYLSDLGNTPDHRNNWSPLEFQELVSRYFKIVTISKPLPWQLVVANCTP